MIYIPFTVGICEARMGELTPEWSCHLFAGRLVIFPEMKTEMVTAMYPTLTIVIPKTQLYSHFIHHSKGLRK